MRKCIFILFLASLFGCADEIPENQSLCIGKLVESTGKVKAQREKIAPILQQRAEKHPKHPKRLENKAI